MIIKRWHKIIAVFVALNMLFEVVYPTAAYALTGGPSQPEVQSFEPVGTTEMVDLFSGDFNYNIPLLDVGGYPINISYHSGIGMDQEASWVGLGWNINPGVINRGMRGIPDDFNGEEITSEFDMKANNTYGISVAGSLQTLGIDKGVLKRAKLLGSSQVSMNLGIFFNNYKGIGYEYGITPTYKIAGINSLSASVGLQANSQSGVTVKPKLNFSTIIQGKQESDVTGYGALGLSASSTFNSRAGLKSLNMSGSVSGGASWKNNNGINKHARTPNLNGSTGMSFGTQTWVPNASTSMRTFGLTLNATIGSEIFVKHPNMTFSGYFNTQYIRDKVQSKRAFGYMYIDAKAKGGKANDVLLDFNRERDGSFTKNTPFLPLPNLTYDQFSVSGQGIGGSYRLHRSDYGIVFDDKSNSTSGSGSIGAEFGMGNLIHGGFNVGVTFHQSKSGRWIENNYYDDGLDFAWRGDIANPLYEPAYFKNEGEKTPADETFYNLIGFDKPVRARINLKGRAFVDRRLIVDNGPSEIFQPEAIIGSGSNSIKEVQGSPADNVRQQRDKRNQVISYLGAYEAQFVGFEKTINSYGINQSFDEYGRLYPQEQIERVDGESRQQHHISEITAINPDGMRYVYGIPAYNNKQIEKTFSVLPSDADCGKGQVSYVPGVDDTNENEKGEDEYYSSTYTPAYAHSYLLTAVLSTDYVDVTGDGVSDDDYGTATKINYSRVSDDYKWRVPFEENRASYNEGLKTNKYDDKGSYIYGEKEIWYIHSIESKNQIAVFKISPRNDSRGVKGLHGGIDATSDTLYRLDSILLYSKQELIKMGGAAIPIKSVHFEYEETAANELCQGVHNNLVTNGGKLTLKKIYFKYSKSNKGKLTPYKFTYNTRNGGGTVLNNYGYNLKGYDRWGNYAPIGISSCTETSTLSSSEFPYTTQDDANADLYASAWTLTKIELPSGGNINIEYESDDYAYVQDKQAMRMFKIKGLNDNPSLSTDNKLFENGTGPGNVDKEFVYLFFDLETNITGANAADQLEQRYFNGMNELYFNVYANVNGKGDYEYIHSWAQIDREASDAFGVLNDNVGWVKLKKVSMGDKEDRGKQVNPISKAIWNHARLYLPDLVYPYSAKGNTKKDILGLASLAGEINRMVKGFYRSLRDQHFGESISLNKSWIRLNEPDKIKNGGGVRVKRITVDDNWENMGVGNTNPTSFEYGQEYIYTKTEYQANGEEWTISSGVAAYEPQIGSDENPWHHAITFEENNLLVPDNRYMMEGPIGESFFPGASVGYSQVTVRNLTHENVERTATGFQIHEFYTAFDYPTIVTPTKLDKSHVKPDFFASLFSLRNEEYMTVSQGYAIELNDMHGKPKAQWTYAENSIKPISGIQYFYKSDPGNPKKLYNKVQTVKSDYSIQEDYVGMDIDFVADMREQSNVTYTGGIETNVETFLASIFPAVVPMILPSYSEEKTQFNSVVTLKVISKYGILDKTIAYQEGSTITTENILFDNETGEVLLTKTQNEFSDATYNLDAIYNFTMPAHWAYEGMGPAYKTVGATFKDVAVTETGITLSNGLDVDDYLMPGDELLVKRTPKSKFIEQLYGSEYGKAWVYDGDANLNLIAQNGENAGNSFYSDNFNQELQVIRPARRNMQSLPVASITTKTNPITFNGSSYSLAFTDVLNTEAIEYHDNWQTFCRLHSAVFCEDQLTDVIHEFGYILDSLAKDTLLLVDNVDIEMTDWNTWYENTKFDSINGICTPGQNLHIYQKWTTEEDTLKYSKIRYRGSFGQCCNYELYLPDDSIGSWDSIIHFFNIRADLLYLSNGDNKHFFIDALKKDGDTITLNGFISCIEVSACTSKCYQWFEPDVINPFTSGLRGNFRQVRGHKYLGERTYATNENVRTDGVYTTYQDYWDTYNSGTGLRTHSTDPKWVWTSEVSKYSPFGAELENRDALNRYSAAIYGYNNTLPIAVASNSKYRQIGFDGFEDYDYLFNPFTCEAFHWNFKVDMPSTASLDDEFQHSGLYSMKLDANTTHDVTRTIFYCENDTNTRDTTTEYKLKACDCIGAFSPDSGKYIISGWIKDSVGPIDTTYSNPIVEVLIDNGTTISTLQFKSSGQIIDGWQRLEAEFDVPANTVSIKVKLKASTSTATYFDDFRLHPFNGNMKTYVYHPINLRLMAELDENNYATFYEYDDEGALIRIKKETVNGIVTIQESRNSFIKRP